MHADWAEYANAKEIKLFWIIIDGGVAACTLIDCSNSFIILDGNSELLAHP